VNTLKKLSGFSPWTPEHGFGMMDDKNKDVWKDYVSVSVVPFLLHISLANPLQKHPKAQSYGESGWSLLRMSIS
jgi:hypothetical protein